MLELYHVQAIAKQKNITLQQALTFIRRQLKAYYAKEAKRIKEISNSLPKEVA